MEYQGKAPRQRCVACASLQRTVRYYLGSIAFGSLLIAIIQAIRLAFLYLQKQMEQAGKGSVLIRWLFFCIQACLKCLQSLVEAVTTNAYIFVALKGDSFCASGGRVFKLIINHGAVFAAVNVLGTIIVFLGQICVAVIAAAVQESTVEDRTLESCITERIRRWGFPEPRGGGVVVVTYPFVFRTTEAG